MVVRHYKPVKTPQGVPRPHVTTNYHPVGHYRPHPKGPHKQIHFNTTCPTLSLVEPATDPIIGKLTFYQLNMIISLAAVLFASVLMFSLMASHARRLSKPKEQLKIMAICTLIPFTASLDIISITNPQTYVYLHAWTDLVQAVVLGDFFLLMCQIASQSDDQRQTFFAALPDGKTLSAYRNQWISIFQYTPVSFIVAVMTCVLEAINKYCLNSNLPVFGHLWLNVIHCVSLLVAVMGVLQAYKVLKKDLVSHKPVAKLLSFILLVMMDFIRQIVFWVLNGLKHSPLAVSKTLNYTDVKVGIPLLVDCLLMVPFSIFFIMAYDVKPYKLSHLRTAGQEGQPMVSAPVPTRYYGGFLGIKAWFMASDPSEFMCALVFPFRIFSEFDKLPNDPSEPSAKEEAMGYDTEPEPDMEPEHVQDGRARGYSSGGHAHLDEDTEYAGGQAHQEYSSGYAKITDKPSD